MLWDMQDRKNTIYFTTSVTRNDELCIANQFFTGIGKKVASLLRNIQKNLPIVWNTHQT